MQNDIDIRNARIRIGEEIKDIATTSCALEG